jgi:hypothetical protein
MLATMMFALAARAGAMSTCSSTLTAEQLRELNRIVFPGHLYLAL